MRGLYIVHFFLDHEPSASCADRIQKKRKKESLTFSRALMHSWRSWEEGSRGTSQGGLHPNLLLADGRFMNVKMPELTNRHTHTPSVLPAGRRRWLKEVASAPPPLKGVVDRKLSWSFSQNLQAAEKLVLYDDNRRARS